MSGPPDLPLVCVCGHGSPWHQHYRDGTDCSICGPLGCPGLRPRHPVISPGLRRALLVTLGVPVLVTGSVLAATHLSPGGVAIVLVTGVVVALYLAAPKRKDH